MSEQKFKVGDRVRYNGSDEGGSWIEVQVDNTFEGTLVKKWNDSEDEWVVKWDLNPVEVEYSDSFVLISRPSDDPKTAFLTELKELLTKYNAEIFAYQPDFEEVTLAFYIGDDAIEYGSGEDTSEVKVTPSNIFDYDK